MCLARFYRQEKAVRSSRGTGLLLLLLMEIFLCNKEYLKPSAKPQSHASPPPKKRVFLSPSSALVRRGDGWHCWREIFFAGKEQSSPFFGISFRRQRKGTGKKLPCSGGFFQRFKEIYFLK